MDHSTTLCLACASSLPPVRSPASPSFFTPFTTRCCSRPICPTCLASNPRLARYDPCLRCLGGVAAVAGMTDKNLPPRNVDGGNKDEDTFVVGDDDEPDEPDDELPSESFGSSALDSKDTSREPYQILNPLEDQAMNPLQYRIQPRDTLRGIALRFGVDGRELCHLNKLPPSTLNTTPHILHTRTVINLPPSAKEKLSGRSYR